MLSELGCATKRFPLFIGMCRSLKNGELLDAAEKQGFEVLVTTDSNLKYQRNLKSRRIAIFVLSTPSWPRIQRAITAAAGAVNAAAEGSYVEVEIP